MDTWVIDRWHGETAGRDQLEHDALAWLNHHELTDPRLGGPRLPKLVLVALDRSQ
jgi:hypothetical protein